MCCLSYFVLDLSSRLTFPCMTEMYLTRIVEFMFNKVVVLAKKVN